MAEHAAPLAEDSSAPEAPAAAPAAAPRRFGLVLVLFLVSGATGLLYEVAFSKLLSNVFGATAYAVSTVLAAFMGGLALGAHLGGRNAGRARRPLVAYGALEIGVGALCVLSPLVLSAVTDAYVALARALPGSLVLVTAVRAALAAGCVVAPTVAMGATLPLLSRVVAGTAEGGSGRRLALLYGTNTLGGATGALVSAYAILPELGVRGTMHAAALANVTIGVLAIVAGRRGPAPAPVDPARAPSPREGSEPSTGAPGGAALEPAVGAQVASASVVEQLALGLAFASGLLVFAAEVVETHLLALLIGNSAYAFGLMLAVFLVCLALGAARAPGLARRHGAAALSLGLGLSALGIAVTLPLWDLLPLLFAAAGKVVHGWAGREATRALAALAILAVPTIFLGTTFPLLLERVAQRTDVASAVGRLTVVNTVGTIAGSILTGYFVLPLLGSQRTLVLVAVVLALLAALAARTLVAPAGRRRLFALAASGAIVALVVPRWDLARLTSGANVYFTMGPRPDRIELVREDVHGGVTTVARLGPIATMYTNGKFQGDDGPEMPAQRRFAHFPSLFVKEHHRALVVGLGTGTTLGTIAGYPFARIDVAEISPAIVEASRAFFRGPSLGALDDPRVHLELNDGRNVLLVASEPYDLVTIELTSVWFAGAASLYSHEFYELVRARLSPGGVLQQWVQLHHIRRRELASIVATIHGVFPHVALFVGGAQGILVASGEPLVASERRLAELERDPATARTLGGATLASMLDEMLASGPELERFVRETEGGAVPPSTDDNLYLEYATPKGNVLEYHSSLEATLAVLEAYRTPDVRRRHLAP